MSSLILFVPLPPSFMGCSIPERLVGKTLDTIRQDKELFLLLLECIHDKVQ